MSGEKKQNVMNLNGVVYRLNYSLQTGQYGPEISDLEIEQLVAKKRGIFGSSTRARSLPVEGQDPIKMTLIDARDLGSAEASSLGEDLARDVGMAMREADGSYRLYSMRAYAAVTEQPVSSNEKILAEQLKALLYEQKTNAGRYDYVEGPADEDSDEDSFVVVDAQLKPAMDPVAFFQPYNQSSGSFILSTLKRRLEQADPEQPNLLRVPAHGISQSGYCFQEDASRLGQGGSGITFVNELNVNYLLDEYNRQLQCSFKAVSEYSVGENGVIDPVPTRVTVSGPDAGLITTILSPEESRSKILALATRKQSALVFQTAPVSGRPAEGDHHLGGD